MSRDYFTPEERAATALEQIADGLADREPFPDQVLRDAYTGACVERDQARRERDELAARFSHVKAELTSLAREMRSAGNTVIPEEWITRVMDLRQLAYREEGSA